MSVSLLEILAAVRARRASLVGETVAYVVLSLADQVVNPPRRVRPDLVRLTEEGAVRLDPSPACSPTQSEADLRALLAQLLADAGVAAGALVRASQREHPGNVAGLSNALEAALVPINRGAMRRAMARICRETEHAIRQAEPELLRSQPPETTPTTEDGPIPPALGQKVELERAPTETGSAAAMAEPSEGAPQSRDSRSCRRRHGRGERQCKGERRGRSDTKESTRTAPHPQDAQPNARIEGSGQTVPLPPVQERTEPWVFPRPSTVPTPPAEREVSPPQNTTRLVLAIRSATGASAAPADLGGAAAESTEADALDRDHGPPPAGTDPEQSVELAEYMVDTPCEPPVGCSAPVRGREASPSFGLTAPAEHAVGGFETQCDPWPWGVGCVDSWLLPPTSEQRLQPGATWELAFEPMAPDGTGMRAPEPSSPPPDLGMLWCAPPVFESSKSDVEQLVSCFSVSASTSDFDVCRFLKELAGVDRTPAPPPLKARPVIAVGAAPAGPRPSGAGQTA